MREIDEKEEEAALLRNRKMKILAVIALGVIFVSFYGWWRKTLPNTDATLIPNQQVGVDLAELCLLQPVRNAAFKELAVVGGRFTPRPAVARAL